MARRTITLNLDAERVERTLPKLGRCRFRGYTLSVCEVVEGYASRPVIGDYRRFADELISASLIEPELSPREVGGLSERARNQLRSGVVEACGLNGLIRSLRGSHLSTDERVFAAAMWRHQEHLGEFAELATTMATRLRPALQSIGQKFGSPGVFGRNRASIKGFAGTNQLKGLGVGNHLLRAAGLGDSIGSLVARQPALNIASTLDPKSHLKGIHLLSESQLKGIQHLLPTTFHDFRGILSGYLKPYTELTASLPSLTGFRGILDKPWRDQERWREVSKLLRRWESSAYWFLLSRMGVRHTLAVAKLPAEEMEAVMLDAIEGAVLDDDFRDGLMAAVNDHPFLPDARKHHLKHALEHAGQKEWLNAYPPLLDGLEGAFWAAARRHNIINVDRGLVERPTKTVKSVEGLFDKLVVVKGPFKTFLVHRVFGGDGNVFRHGEAEEGERRQVLFGIAALAGWLEAFSEEEHTLVLVEHMERHLQPISQQVLTAPTG